MKQELHGNLEETVMKHIVIDLEMNPVDRSNKEIRRRLAEEIIEIGAVKLTDDFVKEEEFQCYVKPQHGKLKKHIISLTGITEDKVENAPPFESAFMSFMDWVGKEDARIYSWSMSDLKQMRQECILKTPDFDASWLSDHWIDLQKAFDDKIGISTNLALKHAIGAMDKNFEGTQHTALADAANTAAILTLMQDDAAFQKTMQPVIDLLKPKEELSHSIGDLYPELMNFKFD